MLAATLDQAIYIFETQPLKQIQEEGDRTGRAPLQDSVDDEDDDG